jgi:hypothetical protein
VTNIGDTYKDGVLTITKAPLTVYVGNYKKEQGTENPEFLLVYEGFKNLETSSVLITEPKILTAATKESPVGEYDIIAYGGEAQNYDFRYVNGTLTITLQNGIDNVGSFGEKTFDIYSTSGVKLRANSSSLDDLPKGVYVIKGKKVVRQ